MAKTNKQLVAEYMRDVLSGKRPAGKLEIAAVQRHKDDLKHAGKRGLKFDESKASAACDFFPILKHTTGEYHGKPFELYPFQRFIVWVLMGWTRKSDGMRRFRRAFISLARGNGKSPFAAALLLLLFAFDSPPEARAECYTAATKRDQAKIVFNEAKRFVEQNPHLKSLIRPMKAQLQIPHNDSVLTPLGQDSKNTDGLIPHVISVDELHAWQERHHDLWDKLITAMGKRRQPLLLVITTAGDDESELWEEQYDLNVAIVDPDSPINADDRFVFICEADEDDDIFEERTWHKANPMLAPGVVKIDHLRSESEVAKHTPARRNTFIRYHLNRKVTASTKLFPAEIWAQGNEELPDLEYAECFGGFDWGWKDDLSALALVFPLETVTPEGESEPKRRYAALCECWIPENGPRDLADEPWRSWIERGLIRVTSGNTTDTASIYARTAELAERFTIKTIAMDPNNCREFGSRVEGEYGIEPFWFGQTHGKYNEPTRELLEALRQGRFVHGGNPLLAWSASNVIGSLDSREYVKPEKKRSKDKIDPICALIMGLSECLFNEREGPSVYETPGALSGDLA